ncbi:MAG TPA: GAF and ANTAR domain-containing protein [Amycolatopsis sp.]|uniref:GAF and ANTAR domain-containing protein n=1 Tax=Amycolatopsis sp. TaxID=37632 RepID=UPI002B472B3A|nr:GAF and ANTAR domain-containing protein [Amycolatopsis sp.]HKS45252.1 GAF and ANTAR domain-containing protein [Amycolatopsis sp.]
MPQEQRLAAAFVELSDVHRPDFEADRYTQVLARHAASLLDVDAAGWALADESGRLDAVGGTTDTVRLLQVVQLRAGEGPAVDSFHSGQPLSVADLNSDSRWTAFRTAVLGAGFAAVHVLPMRVLGGESGAIGALCLFRRQPGELGADDLVVGAALVGVATGCLLLKRATARAEKLSAQLQTALNSRVTIEQAKGILAERRGTSLDNAFELMRAFARHNRRRLNDVACAVVTGSPTVTGLIQTSAEKPRTCLSGWLS